MPQVDAFGRVTTSGTDVQNNQAIDFMLRQALANQQAQVQREGIQSGERVANRGYDTDLAIKGGYAQRAAQETAMQGGHYAGEGALIDRRSAGDQALANITGGFDVQKAGIAAGPAQTLADLQMRESSEGSPARIAQANEAAALAKLHGSVYGQVESAFGGAAGGMPSAPMGGGNALVGGGAPAGGGANPVFRTQDLRDIGRGVFKLGEDPGDTEARAEKQSNRAIVMAMAQKLMESPLQANRDRGAQLLKAQGIDVGGALPYSGAPQVSEDTLTGLIRPKLQEFVKNDESVGSSLAPLTGAAYGIPGMIAGAKDAWDSRNRSAPTAQEGDELKTLFARLQQFYLQANGGDADLAKQQAVAKFEDFAKGYRENGRAVKTKELRTQIGGP